MTNEQRCTRLTMQAKRLREAADRISSLASTAHLHTEELNAEANFIEQIAHGIEVLADTVPDGVAQ